MQSPGPLGTSGADSLHSAAVPARRVKTIQKVTARTRATKSQPACRPGCAGEDTSFGEDFKLHLGCPVCSASLPITAGHERLT